MAFGEWVYRLIGRVSGTKNDGKLRCVQCRKEITGMPLGANCPECGEPVLSSVLRSVPAVPDDAENANNHPARKPFAFVLRETGYPVDAFLFIADVLMRIRKRQAESEGLTFSNTRYVSTDQLGEGLREFAVEFFGDNAEARDVLGTWNLRASEDVGLIIGRMVSAGLLAAGAHDSPEAFNGRFTLDSLFGAEGVSTRA